MLPEAGVYYFPWEVTAGHVPDGGTLRTFGRLSVYDASQSQASLLAQRGPEQHQVLVCTALVEPFPAQLGSLYVVLGELEHQQGRPVLRARALSCAEGLDLPQLERAVAEQRAYRRERRGPPPAEASGTPAPPRA